VDNDVARKFMIAYLFVARRAIKLTIWVQSEVAELKGKGAYPSRHACMATNIKWHLVFTCISIRHGGLVRS
jgi:hypothetical protein